VKVKHLLFIGAAIIGILYVAHMMVSHKGQQILPGIGLGH
jgi:hypothetical protein